MAKRFMLVPSDQYLHLLSNSTNKVTPVASAKDDPIMAHTAKRVNALLKGKKLHVSVRKALFDQELARYLRQRKERAEKPVKVEVVNKQGAQVLIDPKSKNRAIIDGANVEPITDADMSERESTPLQPLATPGVGHPDDLRETPPAPKRVSKRLLEHEETQKSKAAKKSEIRNFMLQRVWEKRREMGMLHQRVE